MSKVGKVVCEIEASMGLDIVKDKSKTSVSARITEEEVFRVDYIAKRLDMSRSAFAGILINEGCLDAAESLGISLSEIQAQYLSKKFNKPVEEYREMLKKTGIDQEAK